MKQLPVFRRPEVIAWRRERWGVLMPYGGFPRRRNWWYCVRCKKLRRRKHFRIKSGLSYPIPVCKDCERKTGPYISIKDERDRAMS